MNAMVCLLRQSARQARAYGFSACRRRLDELGEQAVERRCGILRETRVHPRWLNDGARRRDEPAEPLGRWHGGDRTASRVSVGNANQGIEIGADLSSRQVR